MKDQARSVNYTYCQGMVQDSENNTESPQTGEFIGQSHMIERKNSDKNETTNNPDRVWIQHNQVPKVKFQEKPDIIHEDHDE